MKTQHLQFCDILNSSIEDISVNGRTQTTFVQIIQDITRGFLGNVLNINKDDIPTHSWDMFATPIGAGGFDMPDPELNSLGNLVISMARSIGYALHGITPSNYKLPGTDDDISHIKLPPHIRALYSSW